MSHRSHGSRFPNTARYERRPIVQVVDAATAAAWLTDARCRGAVDGAAGRWHPGHLGPSLLAAYSEAHAAARERVKQAC